MTRQTQAAGPSRRKAFTLIELLVVIAIISLLVSILLPSLKKAKDLATLTLEMSNARAFAMTYLMYGTDNNDLYPYSQRVGYSNDDYSWYQLAMYQQLRDRYGLTREISTCLAYSKGFQALVGSQNPYWKGGNTELGWNVWVGRQTNKYYMGLNSATGSYSSPKRFSDPAGTQSSATLLTCHHYVSDNSWGSVISHFGSMQVRSYKTATLSPAPKGMVVARRDASVSFVPMDRLTRCVASYSSKDFLYYMPGN